MNGFNPIGVYSCYMEKILVLDLRRKEMFIQVKWIDMIKSKDMTIRVKE